MTDPGQRSPRGLDRRSAQVPASPAPEQLLGTVAIVGFPNVGKSTLINRLTSSRAAVVHETHGTTRDRKELVCEWRGKEFLLIDTGGVDIADPDPITRSIADQARTAIAEADLVLFVVDARAGVTPGDEELAQILRESHKPVLVLANKIDDPSQESLALEFHRLGFGEPIPLSALHGSNTGDLLDEILELLPGTTARTMPDDAIRVAILGRPNVGKSSLFNRLLGAERAIVSDVPGTTRDAIDTVIEHGGRTFVLVDTAGLRRKRRQRQGIDYYSELRALEAAERADVALVLIDASQGIVEGDVTAVEVARKAHCSTLIVLSKWDIGEVTIEEVRPELQRRFRQRPPFITTSSETGRGISRILDRVAELFDKHAGRVTTGELNRFLGELRAARQPPSKAGRRLNLLYGAQVTSRPPRFRFTVNDPGLITRDYGYWVENQLRERFELQGVPVAIDFRRRP
jgi:GTPase